MQRVMAFDEHLGGYLAQGERMVLLGAIARPR
jgi:hypothetical protein